jgi:excisionase family DNA binding protein
MLDWLALTQDLDLMIAPRRERWLRMVEVLDQEHGRREYYTVSEAAAFWEVHKETVYRWRRKGEIALANFGERKIRISRQQMLNKRWELRGEPAFFSKLFSGLPERRQANIAGG